MKGFKTFLKFLAAIAAIAAAAAAVYKLITLHNEKMDELDAYLLDDGQEEDEAPSAALADEDYVEQDLDEWNHLDGDQKVQLSMMIEPSFVQDVQNELAAKGYSSTYDQDSKILDMQIQGPQDHEEIVALEDLIKEILTKTNGTYLGFAFL